MISIYAPFISPRLNYICETLFENFLKTPFEIYLDPLQYSKCSGIKINYSDQSLEGLQIIPSPLLSEETINEQSANIGKWKDQPCFYYSGKGDIPFDLFSASFFLLSRYEEYLPFEGDKHNRFPAIESLAYKNDFLEFPIIDFWIDELEKMFKILNPNIILPERNFTCHSSIDVDSAYAYLGKGLYRTIGGFMKDLVKFNFKNSFDRMKTILRISEDPFDTYTEFQNIHDHNNIECIYFFLLADYGPQDINLPHHSSKLKRLIKKISHKNEIGIHPGFVSNYYPEKLELEINRLANITGKNITHSRQHFLMLNFPKTYQNYRLQNIQHDYSMGFSDRIGFRAGTSLNFNFYNLKEEAKTDLICHPFALMDVTLNLYMNLTTEEANQKIKTIIGTLKSLKGQFIPLWHNESISEKWHWKGWKKVYYQMIL